MAGLRADDVDRHVGKQIRARREALGMTNLMEEVAGLSPEAQQAVALLARRLVEKEAAGG